MSKGVGWYVIFIVATIGMFVGAMVVMLWNYSETQVKEATRQACLNKFQKYCYRWVTEKKEPGDWDKFYPTEGCENFGVKKPSKEECENLLEVKIE
jgi:hypothetical protein